MAGAAVKSTARGSVAGVTSPFLVIRMRRMAVLFLHCLEMAKADEFFVLLVP